MQLENKALTVTNLTKYLKGLFDTEPFLRNVIVEGEISNYKRNSSGHLYFTLKDEESQIPCVMFKSQTLGLIFEPKDGDKVYAKGSIEIYEQGGKYQMYVKDLKESGTGDLYKKYEELKNKLEQKGYFNKERKRELPKYPKNIALLTSKTGAVIEDLKSIILKRSQFSNLTLYPMKVQGEDAKFDIVKKIELANKNPDIDVIILARGGGSIEDLWPFNEEIVADAIYNSIKPIISAVGHETDFTISDFTADLRAATPSDAALIVVKDNKDLLNELNHLNERLKNGYLNYIKSKYQYIERLSTREVLKDFNKVLLPLNQRLINLSSRLDLLSPISKLKKEKETLDKYNLMLQNNMKSKLVNLKHDYAVLNEKLNLLNPLSVLDKGYSITYYNGESLKNTNKINVGDRIVTKLKEGTVQSIVEKKE